MNEFGQGLTLSGIGILITFSALGILILLILILKALFPERSDIGVSVPEEALSPGMDLSRENLKKKAAAAGVAVLLSKRSFSRKGGLGSELEKPVDQWWQRGLDRIQGKERL